MFKKFVQYLIISIVFVSVSQAARAVTLEELTANLSQEAEYRAQADTALEEMIDANTAAIGDRQSIHSLNQKIDEAAANLSLSASIQEIGNTVGNMDFTTTRYIQNDRDISSALRTLDSRVAQTEINLSRLDQKVEKQHKEMKRGFASLAALSRLVPNARSYGDTQISVAGGWYRGTTGVAVGAFHYVNNNLLVNAGLGYAGQDSLTFGVGMTFSF